MGMDAIEIFGQRLGKVECALNILEAHTLEEIESVRNELEGHKQAEVELRQTITALGCRITEALSSTDAGRQRWRHSRSGLMLVWSR